MDTFSPFVFLLKPAANSPDMQVALKSGESLVIQWADCGREEFVLAAIQPGAPDAQALLAQTTRHRCDRPGAGQRSSLCAARRATGAGSTRNPEPTDPNVIQADITFGETVVSEDGKTLQTSLTVTNTGSKPITINPTDLSLAAEGKAPLSPLSIAPALPQEIQPGDSLSLTITFPHPGSHTAVLRCWI